MQQTLLLLSECGGDVSEPLKPQEDACLSLSLFLSSLFLSVSAIKSAAALRTTYCAALLLSRTVGGGTLYRVSILGADSV